MGDSGPLRLGATAESTAGAAATAGTAGSGTASAASCALSLSLTTMGAGVLSFPWAAAQTGVVVLVALILAIGALSVACDLIVAEFAFRHRRELRARTFDELVGAVLGAGAYRAAAAQVVLGLAGAVVGFLCVAGDLGTPLLGAALGGRAGVIALFAAAIVLPLAGASRIHALRGASAIGVAAVVAVAALLLVRGASAASASPPPPPPALALPSARGLFLAAPCVIYALGNQVVSTTIFLDATDAVQRAYHKPVAAAFALIGCLYVAAAVGGALAFGSAAHGDVLLNFTNDDAAAGVAKLLMAVHVALVIPVDAVPLRRSLANALRTLWPARSRGGGGGGGGGAHSAGAIADADAGSGASGVGGEGLEEVLIARAPPPAAASTGKAVSPPALSSFAAMHAAAEADARAADAEEAALPHVCGSPCSLAIAAQTAALIATAAGAAILCPEITVVFGLLGATLGITCFTMYPACFLLAKASRIEAAAAAAAVGVAGAGGGASAVELEADDEPGAPIYTPSSPLLLRVQGWSMLVLSTLMVVLGTGECIYVTWLS